MKSERDAHRETFIAEAHDLLQRLESCLIELEKNPLDNELIDPIFRALHTLKGSGRMCGFDALANLAHEVEAVFDLVRHGKAVVTTEIVDLSLAVCDQISSLLDADGNGDSIDAARTAKLIAAARSVSGQDTDAVQPERLAADPDYLKESQEPMSQTTYWIRFRPAQDTLSTGANPIALLSELRALGNCEVIFNSAEVPCLDSINPEFCYADWDAILTTDAGVDAIKDVFVFMTDALEMIIEPLGSERGPALTAADRDRLERLEKLLGRRLLKAVAPSPDVNPIKTYSDPERRSGSDRRRATPAQKETFSSIRVAAKKLDDLVDRVGELVTVQARLTETALMRFDPELTSLAEEVERLTAELREIALGMRTLPIGTIFGKFKRLVRDLSHELGCDAELITKGEETELDKGVIERLDDVLVHLIRNSLDHGIEPPEVREAAGKPRTGKIRLSAVHSGAYVLIKIEDDGAGLDEKAIMKKAVSHGLIAADAEVSRERLFSLIMAPGFTTVKKVTDVSGRGVGMDVVQQTLGALSGTIEIDSRPGAGTGITLKLPLTLAIIEGLLISSAGETYVLPLSIVDECIELTRGDNAKSHGRAIANVRGELIPFIRLRECFFDEGERPPIEQIVVVEVNGRRVGFVADHVIGEHQTVIKNMGRLFRDTEGISGATILGNGRVALIINAQKLAQMAEAQEKTPA